MFADLASSPGQIETNYPVLLSKPSLLVLAVKRAWLHARLKAKVGGADAVKLSLVARRDNILAGLCAQLGVDETTGSLVEGTRAQQLDVTFDGEAAAGDALRREWFGQATAEMVDGRTGLFSPDGQQTLRPNPNSATEAGPDHLSYFALLGRITGLALYPPGDAQRLLVHRLPQGGLRVRDRLRRPRAGGPEPAQLAEAAALLVCGGSRGGLPHLRGVDSQDAMFRLVETSLTAPPPPPLAGGR